MLTKFSFMSFVLLAGIIARIVALGASVGDSIAVLGLVALVGFGQYLESVLKPDVTAEIKKEISDLRTTVNALKIGRTLGKQ